ncbi:hypothetical protein GOP47_0024878 [Adiantum capillus-veneris]|uniref:Uncharacterized protein n=1 Tax=Adiantum capillus-veneris TaxID=13818 RepID=A0A9D4Z309_ADICA|nr:hypothetical protein GOP47_0024878 [Adiantum capillus-veneris]
MTTMISLLSIRTKHHHPRSHNSNSTSSLHNSLFLFLSSASFHFKLSSHSAVRLLLSVVRPVMAFSARPPSSVMRSAENVCGVLIMMNCAAMAAN